MIEERLAKFQLTPFQKKVFLTVSKIPRGKVRSYQWVAKRCGKPDASRAVGRALGRNPLPLAIPCHRVIKSDHKLGGFMLGKMRKAELLRSEGLTVKRGAVIINKKRRV